MKTQDGKKKGAKNGKGPPKSEKRFDVRKDPRFKPVPVEEKRVVVDQRFAKMFTDPAFEEPTKIDMRGNKVVKQKSRLREFYKLEGEEDGAAAGKSKSRPGGKRKRAGAVEAEVPADEGLDEPDEDLDRPSQGSEDEYGTEDGDESVEPTDSEDSHVAFEWDASSSATEDDSESEVEESEEAWKTLEDGVERTEDASCRLAVMGCDWDLVSATDIYVLVSTFLEGQKKSQSLLKNVRVYMSQFGKEQLAKEHTQGPDLKVKEKRLDQRARQTRVHTGKVVNQESQIDDIAAREYQRNRLMYHYAVVVLENVEVACFVYDELDQMTAHGLSPVGLDLRFVPEGLELPEEDCVGECDRVPGKYTPVGDVRTAALEHCKARITWDEDDKKRKVLKKKVSAEDMKHMDLNDYLASSDSEDLDEDRAETLRNSLLGNLSDEEGNEGEGNSMEMTATFDPELDEIARRAAAKAKGEDKEEGEQEALGPWQRYLEKKKQKKKDYKMSLKEKIDAQKKERDEKAEAEAIAADKKGRKSKKVPVLPPSDDEGPEDAPEPADDGLAELDEEEQHFTLRAIRGTKKQREGVEEVAEAPDVNVKDPRLERMFNNPDFAIDPTHPAYKSASDANEALLEENLRRKKLKRKQVEAKLKRKQEGGETAKPAQEEDELGGFPLFAAKKPRKGA
eukprot:CAMPEP_0204325288 /NCGR_PEP_ID=MMETSP0469-20131031/10885_1 /ASSEMBLY_ACC=CAM_ASM_000384 /TAXON_ID=2969 /ORGANISM="Oxyrrhis marina" /LENGTH=676 /DNA_ID=CAMNT_0051307101 /DNA_START=33 /DNA_END=2063 /DNA_ORIENTATION=-